ncbi:hypothetical protein HPP92_012543 [Vanilla planifolia]|uniref:Uncharacterized protein n=1 Tax=Vanilla planifolia TaxID=51239 RepID=A0A835QX29_VANPL|nr:hypothetical protein HPP92_012955 [Vanilla planifolia]KAG0477824.1 hypothetical protein HPP92_012543 [Vanilla planifolia]
MVSSKRLIQMARRWKKMAILGRKRILSATGSMVASRGHVFVYSMDGRRFTIPLADFSRSMLVELLRMSEEEFGLPTDGPITLPFDGSSMEYILSLLRHQVPMDVERAALVSISSCRCMASALMPHELQKQQVVI